MSIATLMGKKKPGKTRVLDTKGLERQLEQENKRSYRDHDNKNESEHDKGIISSLAAKDLKDGWVVNNDDDDERIFNDLKSSNNENKQNNSDDSNNNKDSNEKPIWNKDKLAVEVVEESGTVPEAVVVNAPYRPPSQAPRIKEESGINNEFPSLGFASTIDDKNRPEKSPEKSWIQNKTRTNYGNSNNFESNNPGRYQPKLVSSDFQRYEPSRQRSNFDGPSSMSSGLGGGGGGWSRNSAAPSQAPRNFGSSNYNQPPTRSFASIRQEKESAAENSHSIKVSNRFNALNDVV